MMYPSESLARAARQQYHSLTQAHHPWVPFFPPFTQAELPPPPAFMSKNPMHGDEWEELPSREQAEQNSMLRLGAALVMGITLVALALTGLMAYPFVQEQTGISLLGGTQMASECWCESGVAPGPQAFARGLDITMDISTEPQVQLRGTVGILLQTTQTRSTRCMALSAAPSVHVWGWQVEGRPSKANATRTADGKKICVHFNQTLPWPASYVSMKFLYTQPLNESFAAEPKLADMPLNISCSNPAHHKEPFALFPFLEGASSDKIIGSASFSTLWNLNITAPSSYAVLGAVDGQPLKDLGQLAGTHKGSELHSLAHIFRASTPTVPSLTLTAGS